VGENGIGAWAKVTIERRNNVKMIAQFFMIKLLF
jgi:hypothetical protein